MQLVTGVRSERVESDRQNRAQPILEIGDGRPVPPADQLLHGVASSLGAG